MVGVGVGVEGGGGGGMNRLAVQLLAQALDEQPCDPGYLSFCALKRQPQIVYRIPFTLPQT